MQTTTTPLNDTKSSSDAKFDCAKLCPCGGAAIPVPDQWLEVMVTGGFKVWHIIFIIIAFMVTMVVVYCCFHRCRIPRTKQEIEADLMRSNLANKFRDYLSELPNEPTTFIEALKKVRDIEEKMEQDDAMMSRDLIARKRMGWLKLKGKGDGKDPTKEDTEVKEDDKVTSNGNLETVIVKDAKTKTEETTPLSTDDAPTKEPTPTTSAPPRPPSPPPPPVEPPPPPPAIANGTKTRRVLKSKKPLDPSASTKLASNQSDNLLKPVEPKQRKSRKRDRSRQKLQQVDNKIERSVKK